MKSGRPLPCDSYFPVNDLEHVTLKCTFQNNSTMRIFQNFHINDIEKTIHAEAFSI